MDLRTTYLDDPSSRSDFVRAAAFLAALAKASSVDENHRAWLLVVLEMLTTGDHHPFQA